jgi:NAD(P)-dependent dehydrogenase (short-subunit alcohol dehydrogenase family)
MKIDLKPLSRQTIVITGATSGHGLCTARMAAAQGANVMLAARDEAALRKACEEITVAGGVAEFTVTDVGDEEAVEQLAERTIERFGGFDTWVNNAGIGVYAKVFDLTMEDHRRVFETNYWGVVYGSIVAARHLMDRPGGGALINVGSINSDMAGPILASYNATKHAVKGFTDSFRIELQSSGAPVSVTLIKPSAIGTPFPEHARNATGYQARLPRPIYAPDVVARAILDAAQHPRRSVTVGAVGKIQVLGAQIFPRLFDRIAASMEDKLLDRETPVAPREGNLFAPQGNDGEVEGRQHGRHFSVFTAARRNGWKVLGTAAALVAAGTWAITGTRARAST